MKARKVISFSNTINWKYYWLRVLYDKCSLVKALELYPVVPVTAENE